MNRAELIDWIALWVLVMGVWPFADPGHGADSVLSVVDLALHVVALLVLASRWRLILVRRSKVTSLRDMEGKP